MKTVRLKSSVWSGLCVMAVAVLATGCAETPSGSDVSLSPADVAPEPGAGAESDAALSASSTATFGGGCFWCTEAVYQELAGVKSVVSGFAGGKSQDVDYYEVARGNTGHAEVVQIKYDPSVITYSELLEVFWQHHDPTTLNRQGADVGPQYRSIILYHDDDQKAEAQKWKTRLNDEKVFDNPVVTEIVAFTGFIKASADHQDYFDANRNGGYCQAVIQPKVDKIRKLFADKLK